MFFLKKLLLAAVTLSLVGTAGILPAQAIALNFPSADGTVRGNLSTTESAAPEMEYHWVVGPLGLVLIKEEQPTRSKIPESSPALALLLLGCGWLLYRQRKTTAIP